MTLLPMPSAAPLAALLIATLSASAAAATATPSAPSAPAQRGTAILRICAAEAARFCPADLSSGRNLAICLRPYRSSLSLSCRRVVTTARP